MFHVAADLLLGVLAVNAAFTRGTNQHLICKTVNDIFTDDSSAGHSQTTPRLLHGPPGKRGQTGVKGEPGTSGLKGEKGAPGLVDPQNVANVVEQKCAEANRELLGRIEELEQFTTQLNSTVADYMEKIQCNEGFIYGGKCYFAIIPGDRSTNLESARNLCRDKGATLADILNPEHQQLAANHIRPRSKTFAGNTEVWLGMSYTYSTSTFQWSNGVNIPTGVASSMRWWSSFPISNSNYNIILLAVKSSKFGFFNNPSHHHAYGVVCEK